MRFKKYYNGSQRLDCIAAATLVLGYGAKWWQNVKICHQQPQNVINSTLTPFRHQHRFERQGDSEGASKNRLSDAQSESIQYGLVHI